MKLKKTQLEPKKILTILFQLAKIKPWHDYVNLTSRYRLIKSIRNKNYFYNFSVTVIYPVLDELG